MPTSSQALILFNNDTGKETRNVAATSRSYYSLRDQARPSVASVYNINGLYTIPAVAVKDEEAVSFFGTATAQLFKYYELPKGYKSIISFDPLTKTFCWRILGGQSTRNESGDETEVPGDRQPLPDLNLHRPATASASRSTRPVVDRDLYDRLRGLGFRASGFDVREVSKPSPDRSKPSSATKFIRRSPARKAPVRKTVSEPKKLVQHAPLADKRKLEVVSSPVASAEDETDDDESSLDEDVDPDGFYRILPSLCMRSEMPPSKPRSAIFSFRHNEEQSHFEVTNLIFAQTGLKVTGLQFDPVNLRSSKPGLRSRWVADFHSADEMETFVCKGLTLGKDRMIIYKFDDVAKREFSTYKYFKSVQDAKKSLKGTKSQKFIDKSKKALKLKGAQSGTKKNLMGQRVEGKTSHVR